MKTTTKGGRLVVDVPQTVTARYLVPTRISAQDARRVGTDVAVFCTSGQARAAIERLAATGRIEIASTWPHGEATGYEATGREALRGLGECVSVRITARPGIPPVGEWACRAVAAAIARITNGTLVDVATGRTLTAAESWASLREKEDGNVRFADWIEVTETPENVNEGDREDWGSDDDDEAGGEVADDKDCDACDETVTLLTAGLRRFGLPELHAHGVPAWLACDWRILLTALASRLWAELVAATYQEALPGEVPLSLAAPATVKIPERIELTRSDVASAYGIRDNGVLGSAPLRLALRHNPDGPVLEVLESEGWEETESAQQYYEEPSFHMWACDQLWPALDAARMLTDLLASDADLETVVQGWW
jgi:hypothetical protein